MGANYLSPWRRRRSSGETLRFESVTGVVASACVRLALALALLAARLLHDIDIISVLTAQQYGRALCR
jgi:hypothetical protein